LHSGTLFVGSARISASVPRVCVNGEPRAGHTAPRSPRVVFARRRQKATKRPISGPQARLAVIKTLPWVADGSGTTRVAFESLHRFRGAKEIVQALLKQC